MSRKIIVGILIVLFYLIFSPKDIMAVPCASSAPSCNGTCNTGYSCRYDLTGGGCNCELNNPTGIFCKNMELIVIMMPSVVVGTVQKLPVPIDQ